MTVCRPAPLLGAVNVAAGGTLGWVAVGSNPAAALLW
eukprot:gene19149-24967_t